VKNTSEYRLLAGPMNVISDDNYVGMVSIGVGFFNPRSYSACSHCISTIRTYIRVTRLPVH